LNDATFLTATERDSESISHASMRRLQNAASSLLRSIEAVLRQNDPPSASQADEREGMHQAKRRSVSSGDEPMTPAQPDYDKGGARARGLSEEVQDPVAAAAGELETVLPSEKQNPCVVCGASQHGPHRYCTACYGALWKDAQRVVDICARRSTNRHWFTGQREQDLLTFEAEASSVGRQCLSGQTCPPSAYSSQAAPNTRCTRCRTRACIRLMPDLAFRLLKSAYETAMRNAMALADVYKVSPDKSVAASSSGHGTAPPPETLSDVDLVSPLSPPSPMHAWASCQGHPAAMYRPTVPTQQFQMGMPAFSQAAFGTPFSYANQVPYGYAAMHFASAAGPPQMYMLPHATTVPSLHPQPGVPPFTTGPNPSSAPGISTTIRQHQH